MTDDPEAKSRVFAEHRARLFGMAYRMLGSVSDAEDIVQDTWLRWARADGREIRAPRAWLVTAANRLCLDRLKSARVQREQYYGTWLPEPLVEAATTPDARVDESVSIALLLVLEKLSPVERAGFLLHDVFGHTFAEIAGILGKPEPACRKLVSRARARVRAAKPKFTATPREHEQLLRRFLEACREGEMSPLLELLGASAALYSDGGGKATALPKVLADREKIARFFINVTRQNLAGPDPATYRFTSFNGVPGVLVSQAGRPVTAICLEIADGKITAIFAHRNPDKLARFQ